MTNKRDLILDATLNLLATRGFHGFSIRDVAQAAKVATGTLYLYFADREDLIEQLHTEIVHRVAQYVFTSHDPEQSLQKQFQGFCMAFWSLFKEQPSILLSKSQFDHMPLEAQRSRHQYALEVFAPMTHFFAQGREQGLIKDLPDDILTSLCFEPYFVIARRSMLGLIDVDDAALEKIIQASWDAIEKRRN
jgi:TetR/AcrR family transcriptional regulator, multidrug resistance operon repressor